MGRKCKLNLKKRWAAGALTVFLCLSEATVPMAAYAANTETSSAVSSVPNFDTSSPNYTGTTTGTTSSSGTTSTGATTSSQTSDGPQVIEVTPTETYYSDYDIYCEAINNRYFFYANVANNGITDQAVSIDFPANVTYTMEKDGVVTEYLSKHSISDYGTYVFQINVNEDTSKPVSEQVVYQAVFMFRIQKKVVKETESAASSEEGLQGFQSSAGTSSSTKTGNSTGSGTSSSSGLGSWDVSSMSTLPAELQDTYRPGDFSTGSGNTDDGQSATVDAKNAAVTEIGSTDESAAENESQSESESAESAESKDTKEDETSDSLEKSGTSEELHTSYVTSRGTYRTEYPDGSYMEVTNPNGMIGNTKIYVSLEGMGESPNITVLKNGKKVDFPDGGAFEEPGDFCLLVKIDGKTYPYSFRILNSSDCGLDSYTIPEGLTLTAVSIDGRAVDPDIYKGKDGVYRLDLTEEASYDIEMSDPDGPDFTASLTIDRTSPKVTVTKSHGSALFDYESQEIAEIVVNNGKTEETYTQLSSLSDPGTYEVSFYDYAGNVTTVSATVKRQINMASVVAILMILVLIGLIVVFYRKTKGEMNVK